MEEFVMPAAQNLHMHGLMPRSKQSLIRSPRRRGRALFLGREAKRLGRLEIDDEIEFGGLFDWDVGRLRPTQNLVDEFGGAAEEVRVVCSIGDQTTRLHVLPGSINCRQSRALCQSVD